MKYRREIDGLRAVAVLPVIMFHAGFNAFSGGFVGVDIFFVISGYLITTIILADMENGKFSLLVFYERRARRILPALSFIILCCLPFAWFWLLPGHLNDFSKSLMSLSVFSSNILFWLESGYFETASELKPLLHTWSLAVEEQYYLFFPLFLILVWKLRKRWIFTSLVALSVASLSLAQWGSYYRPYMSFYLLPTRIWEIAIGALIAFYLLYKKDHADFVRSKRYLNEVFGFLGVALIAYSIVSFDKTTPFPGIYALIPTVGSGLVIVFTSPRTYIGRFLGTRIMVGIGLISYSIYLWHQPLFVFARHRSLDELGIGLLLCLSAASVMLAFLSWRYVEMPFRDKKKFSRQKIFGLGFAISASFVALGFAGDMNDGWPSRVPKDTYALAEEARKNTSPLQRSQLLPYENPDASHQKIIYLIGDSYAAQLSSAFKEGAHSRFFWYGESLLHGCPPVLGVKRQLHDFECSQYNYETYKGITLEDKIEVVVVVSSWTGHLARFKGDYLLKLYADSIETLLRTGKKIVLVYPFPTADSDVPDFVLKTSFLYGKEIKDLPAYHGSTAYEEFKERNKSVYQLFDNIKDRTNLIRVFPENVFCNSFLSGRCVVQNDGEIFYRDISHLSKAGAKLVVDEIFRQIDQNQGHRDIFADSAQ